MAKTTLADALAAVDAVIKGQAVPQEPEGQNLVAQGLIARFAAPHDQASFDALLKQIPLLEPRYRAQVMASIMNLTGGVPVGHITLLLGSPIFDLLRDDMNFMADQEVLDQIYAGEEEQWAIMMEDPYGLDKEYFINILEARKMAPTAEQIGFLLDNEPDRLFLSRCLWLQTQHADVTDQIPGLHLERLGQLMRENMEEAGPLLRIEGQLQNKSSWLDDHLVQNNSRLTPERRADLLAHYLTEQIPAKPKNPLTGHPDFDWVAKRQMTPEGWEEILQAGSFAKITTLPDELWTALDFASQVILAKSLKRDNKPELLVESLKDNPAAPMIERRKHILLKITLWRHAGVSNLEPLLEEFFALTKNMAPIVEDWNIETPVVDLNPYLRGERFLHDQDRDPEIQLVTWKEGGVSEYQEKWDEFLRELTRQNPHCAAALLYSNHAPQQVNVSELLVTTALKNKPDIVQLLAALATQESSEDDQGKRKPLNWLGLPLADERAAGQAVDGEEEDREEQISAAMEAKVLELNKQLNYLIEKVPGWKEFLDKYPRLRALVPGAVAFWTACGAWKLEASDLTGVSERILLAQIFGAHKWMRQADGTDISWADLVEPAKRMNIISQMEPVSAALREWLQQAGVVGGQGLALLRQPEVDRRCGGKITLREDEDLKSLATLGPGLQFPLSTNKLIEAGKEENLAAPRTLVPEGYWFRPQDGEDVSAYVAEARTGSLALRMFMLGDKYSPDMSRRLNESALLRPLFTSLMTQASPESALALLASPEASLRSLASKQAWNEERASKARWTQVERLERRRALFEAFQSQEHGEEALDWQTWNQTLHRLNDASKQEPDRFRNLKSFARMIEVADDWHKEFGSLHVNKASAKAWPHMAEFPIAMIPGYRDEKYEIVHLGDSVQIAEEGAAMAHCVGSYRTAGMKGNSILYSIRQEGERLATAELSPEGKIIQMYGYKDAMVPQEHRERLYELFDYLTADATRRRAVLLRAKGESEERESVTDKWIESSVQSSKPLELIDRELRALAQDYPAAKRRLAARAAITRYGEPDLKWLAEARPELLGQLTDIRQEVRGQALAVLAQEGLRAAREIVRTRLPAEATIFDAELIMKAKVRDVNDPGIDWLLARRPELKDEQICAVRASQFEPVELAWPEVEKPEHYTTKLAGAAGIKKTGIKI